MTYRIELVPLATEKRYEYTSSIEGRAFKFKFNLNARTGVYHLDLLTTDGNEVLTGIPLLPLNTIASRYNLETYGLTGYFILLPFSENQEFTSILPEDLPKHYVLYYVYEVV